jgi:hypothetical protein
MPLLKKTHSAVIASAITLLPRASCLEGAREESAINSGRRRVIMIEPHCLTSDEGRVPLFQGGFAGHGKWFRGSWCIRLSWERRDRLFGRLLLFCEPSLRRRGRNILSAGMPSRPIAARLRHHPAIRAQRPGVVIQLSLRFTSSPKHWASVIWTFCSPRRGKSAGRSQAHMQVPRHGRNHRCGRRHLLASGAQTPRAPRPAAYQR